MKYMTSLLTLICCVNQRMNNILYEHFTKVKRFSNSKSLVRPSYTTPRSKSVLDKCTSACFHKIKCLRHCSSFLSTAIPKWAINKPAAILHFMNLLQWLIFCSLNIKRLMEVNVQKINVMFHTVSLTFTLFLGNKTGTYKSYDYWRAGYSHTV